MTGILNTITHIGNYAGIGMLMLILGMILAIFAIIKISNLRRVSRDIERAEFNSRFVRDTGSRISDVEAGAKRKEAARNLGINKR
jgi:hypothetical protein